MLETHPEPAVPELGSVGSSVPEPMEQTRAPLPSDVRQLQLTLLELVLSDITLLFPNM